MLKLFFSHFFSFGLILSALGSGLNISACNAVSPPPKKGRKKEEKNCNIRFGWVHSVTLCFTNGGIFGWKVLSHVISICKNKGSPKRVLLSFPTWDNRSDVPQESSSCGLPCWLVRSPPSSPSSNVALLQAS